MRINRYMPTPRECALLLLQLIDELRGDRERITRARLGKLTLRRLWNRPRIQQNFFSDVQDWMYQAGWALFDAGTTYAAVRIDAVENWPPVSSKRIGEIIIEVVQQRYDFEQLDFLLVAENSFLYDSK